MKTRETEQIFHDRESYRCPRSLGYVKIRTFSPFRSDDERNVFDERVGL